MRLVHAEQAEHAEQAVELEPSAALQRATREFTSRYEHHAYLVYNLALRITCEAAPAIDAAEQGVLTRALSELPEDQLVAATLSAALGRASRKPRPHGAGDPESERCLRANARLTPPERAALALGGLWGADARRIGAAMEIGEDAAARLEAAASDRFAYALNEPAERARSTYAQWLWAQPPDALWDRAYAGFYRAAETAVRGGALEAAAAGALPDPSLAPASSAATVELAATPAAPPPRRHRRGRGRRLAFVAAIALPAIVVAGALAYPQLRTWLDQGHHAAPASQVAQEAPASPAAPSVTLPAAAQHAPPGDKLQALLQHPHKPLTPVQLDKLRLDELNALKKYTQQQTDHRLSQAQRDYAARRVAMLRDLALRRQEASRRARSLARRERALRRHSHGGGGNGTIQVQIQQDGSSSQPGGGSQPNGGSQPRRNDTSAPQNQSDAQKSCLYDPDNGTYVCQR